MSESAAAAGCVVRGLLVEGSSGLGEGRALPAAMRAATRHAPFLLRQLAPRRTSRPSARHEGMFPLFLLRPCASSARSAPSLRGVMDPDWQLAS
jgi:hypothetical protein